jgi:hypothetical protein
MAKAKNKITASSSSEANPHFLGRYKPASHTLHPELRQTAYSTRQMILDFIRVVRERADSTDVTEEHRAGLKDNVGRVEPALSGLVGVLNERGHDDLLDVIWTCFHIGRIGDPHLRNRAEAMRRDAAIRKRLENGERPGSTVTWDRFCDAIRDDCGARIGNPSKRKFRRGYSDRWIKQSVGELKARF